MSCQNDCTKPLVFPRPIHNRPGLARIAYRIGSYADIRDALLQSLDAHPTLRTWTHRSSDDPGIALLEGAAVLGDILTFYQEAYANEAYLRTAAWRESVGDLVRLLGYRLSPGVGGQGTFAFTARGDAAVTIPAGFPVKAQLEELDQATEFETTEAITAYPALNAFPLYRPRRAASTITAGLNQVELQAAGGQSDVAALQGVDVAPGDRIMLVPLTTMFDQTGTYVPQQEAEILVVADVRHVLDRTIITFEGSLVGAWDAEAAAYRLGRSFKHFGHNAPAQLTTVTNGVADTTTTQFAREIWHTHTPDSDADFYSTIPETELPLAEEVDDLAVGNPLICQGRATFDGQAAPVSFTVVKEVRGLRADALVWGNMSGAATVLTIDSRLIKNSDVRNEESDIRTLLFHEVTSPLLTLQAPSAFDDGPFSDATLYFFGTHAEAVLLAERRVALVREDGLAQTLQVASRADDFSLSGRDATHPWRWPVILSESLDAFAQEDFDEENPTVTVYGNLADGDQGKTEREAVLGNGDSRQAFQTFKLPKAPLTYHLSAGVTPPEVPELEIYVADRLWTHVPSFFGHGGDEEIYIVREDADGNSYVQFGDGKTGKRLPSGVGNVVARYRTGVGAHGPLEPDATVQAGQRLDRLDKVYLPGLISGGDEAESGDHAREAALGKIQSLGRLVSLQDFESEVLAVPGVAKAVARWGLVENAPTVTLTVLMDTGRVAEIEAFRTIMADYNRCRGPNRFPVRVEQGFRAYVGLAAEVAYDPAYRQELAEQALMEALGAAGDDAIDGSEGLFALKHRSFGQREYATRIAGIMQNVEGVQWTRVTGLTSLGPSDEPSALSLPAGPFHNDVVPCDGQHLLALYHDHVNLSPVALPTAEECADG